MESNANREASMLTPKDVAKILQVSVHTAVLMCARGDLRRAQKINRRWWIPEASIDEFFREAVSADAKEQT